MKLALAALLTAAAVTACGAETATKIPAAKDLIGTWSQNGAGYEEGKPVTWKDQTLVVEAAEGQGFVGRLVEGKILGQYVEVVKGESQVLNVELVRK